MQDQGGSLGCLLLGLGLLALVVLAALGGVGIMDLSAF